MMQIAQNKTTIIEYCIKDCKATMYLLNKFRHTITKIMY